MTRSTSPYLISAGTFTPSPSLTSTTNTFILRPTANDGVDCMHGPSECMGNILELCARELYPNPKINLGFIMCLSRDYEDIPERSLVEDCALESAIDFQQLNDCAVKEDGAWGVSLLRDSIKRTSDVRQPNLNAMNNTHANINTRLV